MREPDEQARPDALAPWRAKTLAPLVQADEYQALRRPVKLAFPRKRNTSGAFSVMELALARTSKVVFEQAILWIGKRCGGR